MVLHKFSTLNEHFTQENPIGLLCVPFRKLLVGVYTISMERFVIPVTVLHNFHTRNAWKVKFSAWAIAVCVLSAHLCHCPHEPDLPSWLPLLSSLWLQFGCLIILLEGGVWYIPHSCVCPQCSSLSLCPMSLTFSSLWSQSHTRACCYMLQMRAPLR